LHGVTGSCRSHLSAAVAVLLVVLALSPSTSPFSKLSFAAIPHHTASVLARTADPFKTIYDKITVVSGVDGRTAIVPLIELPVRFLSASVDRDSIELAVLRI
jgi:hypothetical protein